MQATPSVPSPISPGGRAIEVLRIAMGVIWSLNLLFIVLPAADYWTGFSSVASGYGGSTPGGPGFANFVAANDTFFAWLIAVVTVYLAVAFLLGFTTRLACAIGFVASVVFLWTQYATVFAFPGGTDVGAHPLYLAIYVTLALGGAGRFWSADSRIWKSGRAFFRRIGRWVAAPPT